MDETDISMFNFGKRKKDKHEHDGTSTNNEIINKGAFDAPVGPIVSVPTSEDHYDTSHRHIGTALIFNHKEIRGEKTRYGTEKDRSRIKKVLKTFGFDVRTFDDLTFAEVSETLKDVSSEDHSGSDCLLVVVMTHGLEGKVFAKDMSYPVDRLWTPFLGENCRSLINKPKLFFIQACRGDKLESPVMFTSFRPMSRMLDETDAMLQHVTFAIPNTADLLVMYSTYEGSYSWRNPLNGSWFIQSLCEALEHSALNRKDIELYYLLTTVNRIVAYGFQSNVPDNEKFDAMKEMPNFVSTLTKMFYFRIRNDGSYSWRNPLNGSWFIQSLCEALEHSALNRKDIELYYLLTTVNRIVAYGFQSNVPDNEKFDAMKEMPNFVSTLTKMFYFRIRNDGEK